MLVATKSKNNKKKKGGKNKANGEVAKPNDIKIEEEQDLAAQGEEAESRTPTEPPTPTVENDPRLPSEHVSSITKDPDTNGVVGLKDDQSSTENDAFAQENSSPEPSRLRQTERRAENEGFSTENSGRQFDTLTQERDALREEVAQVRKALEDLQARHEAEIERIRAQLAHTENDKEQAESQYRNLLVKVNTIRSQLGDRLKADAVRAASLVRKGG